MDELDLIWISGLALLVTANIVIAVSQIKRIKELERKTDMLDHEAASTFGKLQQMKQYWS